MSYRVAEVFGPTIQGEGPSVGVPTYFIRLGGCDYRCSWCDSMHAVLPEKVKLLPSLNAEETLSRLKALPEGATKVVISGGNPLLYDLTDLCKLLVSEGYSISVETQGSVFKPWLEYVDEIVVSPKPPSSKMNVSVETIDKFFTDVVSLKYSTRNSARMRLAWKFVAFDKVDVEFAREMANALGLIEIWLSVGTDASDTTESLLERYRNLIDLYFAQPFTQRVHIFPQMHVLLWGHKLGV